MENTNDSKLTANSYPQTFEIKRRTPGARAKLIIGRVAIVVSFLLIVVFVVLASSGAADEGAAFIPLGIAAPIIIVGIVLCVSSNNSMDGTMTFYKGKAIYTCGNEHFEILPDKITAAHRSFEKVMIVFSGIKLKVVSEQAPEIMKCLDVLVNSSERTEAESEPEEPAEVSEQEEVTKKPAETSGSNLIDPNILREYKKLVDEGVITQEQFNEILRKNT